MSVTDRSRTHEAWLPPEHPMHRPRHGRRQLTALICAGLFFLVPTLVHSVGIHPARFENRPLAGFGDPRQGWAWLGGLPAWAADHLPFRDSAVHVADAVSRGVFDEPAALSEPSAGPVLAPSSRPPLAAFPAVIEGRDGWLYLGADVSGACLPSRSLSDTVAALRRLRAVVEASGRQFVLVVPPDKTTMVPEHLPADYLGKDCASRVRSEFWPRVVAEAGAIDLRPALVDIARRKGSPAYAPADTHWSQEGGLAMTYALADRVVPGITRTWQGAPSGVIPWPDDLPPLIGRSSVRQLATYSLAPDGRLDRTRSIASDFRVALRLTSEPAPGTVTVPVRMIADSFTQFASRYLAAAFTDLTVVHPETAAATPRSTGHLLSGGQVIVLELAERNLISGTSPILYPPFLDNLATHLTH